MDGPSDLRKVPTINKAAAIKEAVGIEKAAHGTVALRQAELYIRYLTLEGIGFGSCLPELTEKMYRSFHDNIDMETWSYYRARLDLPEEPPVVSLEEQEETVLLLVGNYALAYFPELIEPLGLPLP